MDNFGSKVPNFSNVPPIITEILEKYYDSLIFDMQKVVPMEEISTINVEKKIYYISSLTMKKIIEELCVALGITLYDIYYHGNLDIEIYVNKLGTKLYKYICLLLDEFNKISDYNLRESANIRSTFIKLYLSLK